MAKKTRGKICRRCGSDISDGVRVLKGHDYVPEGFCRDCTCPFSNHFQSCKAGWNGHPKMDPYPTNDDAPIPCTCHKKRGIEMYIGRMDHTWDTLEIEIPSNTPKDKIEIVAIAAMTEKLEDEKVVVAFIGVYHIGDQS